MGAEVITAITDFKVMTLARLFFSISAILKVLIIFDRELSKLSWLRHFGIEPRPDGLEPSILPLYYTAICVNFRSNLKI